MRKIFKFSLFALFISFASCEDATDIIQESELNDDAAYRTVEDLQSGLIGVYAQYGPDFAANGQGDIFLFNDLFTDNLKRGTSNLGQGSEEYNFVMQPGSNVPTTVWANRYAAINFANRTLRAWNRIAPGLTGDDLAEANRIKAELLAMRALCHFDLLQYFAPSYTDRNAPGVIIMNFVPEINEDFPRNSVGEVFDFINEDLNMAADLIGGNNTENKFFVNADVVKAIHARVALFEGNYTLASTLASELVDAYPLDSATEYFNMWIQDSDAALMASEAIFVLSRLQGDAGVAGNWYANRVDIDGSPFLEMSNQLFDLYAVEDVRRSIFVDDSSPVLGDDTDRTILIGKYPGSGRGQLVNHIKLFRSSEMVLIMAETQARAGNLTGAAASLKMITDARYTSDAPDQLVFANEDDALEEILLERRKELAFEGHRYLDIKRLGAELNIGISRDSRDCTSFSAPCDIAASDFRFTLPIPQSEISSNPSIQQNPGY